MDRKHPNRKKDKMNPYTLSIENGSYYISFTDPQTVFHKEEISADLYAAFNRFELEDISHINKINRHIIGIGRLEEILSHRIIAPDESLEDNVYRSIMYQKLHEAIRKLPDTQSRRIRLYYFEGYTYEQIAEIEGCTHPAIIKSIKTAERHIRELLK